MPILFQIIDGWNYFKVVQTESSVERYSKVITVFYGIIILIIYCKRERERETCQRRSILAANNIDHCSMLRVVKLLNNYFNCSVEAGSHL